MAIKIIRNSAKCLRCGDEIESKYRHDFQVCSCDNVMVDGGKDYFRRGAADFSLMEDTSVVEGEDDWDA